jgi:hypothetical protein
LRLALWEREKKREREGGWVKKEHRDTSKLKGETSEHFSKVLTFIK